MTDQPADPDRPNNLWEPLPGDAGAHGTFGSRAHKHSPQLWATMHRPWVILAGLGLVGGRCGRLEKGARSRAMLKYFRDFGDAIQKQFRDSVHAVQQKISHMPTSNEAPGAPGAKPHWASAAKTGVGTAIGSDSCLWFSLSHGIISEVFDASVDDACLRGMGFIVTNGDDFFSDELHDVDSAVSYLADGVPAFKMKNRCRRGRYQIEKTVLSDPRRRGAASGDIIHRAAREPWRLLVVPSRRAAFEQRGK